VAVVTIHAGAKAGGSESNRGLANHGEVAIIAVGVSPNAINLNRIMSVEKFIEISSSQDEGPTKLPPQTTAMTERGSTPTDWGSNVFQPGLLPSLPKTTYG
jgi:hypothetical protein